MDDISSSDTRALFTALIVVWAVHRLLLWRRSTRAVEARLDHGHRERGAVFGRRLPLVWSATIAGALLEVWVFRAAAPTPLLVLGVVLLLLAWTLRVLSMRQLKNRWTFRVLEPNPDPAGVLAGFRFPDLMSMRAELVGLPLLHGAAFTALLGWVVLVRYQRAIAQESAPSTDPE